MLTSRPSISASSSNSATGMTTFQHTYQQPTSEGVSGAQLLDTTPKTADQAAIYTLSSAPAFQATAPRPQYNYGNGHASDTVTASCPSTLGRVEKATEEEDLCNYLDEVGIEDAQCRKLENTDGLCHTTAFVFPAVTFTRTYAMMNSTGRTPLTILV